MVRPRQITKIHSDDPVLNRIQDQLAEVLNPALSAISQDAAVIPTAAVLAFAGATAPSGYLLCNGSAVSRLTYADLFTAIGVTYGAGDGSTTFNVPDLRSRSVLGAGQGSGLTSRTLGATGGEESHALSTAELASHTHSVTPQMNVDGGVIAGHPEFGTANTYTFVDGGSVASGSFTSGSAGSGSAHNNMSPFLAVNYVIKT